MFFSSPTILFRNIRITIVQIKLFLRRERFKIVSEIDYQKHTEKIKNTHKRVKMMENNRGELGQQNKSFLNNVEILTSLSSPYMDTPHFLNHSDQSLTIVSSFCLRCRWNRCEKVRDTREWQKERVMRRSKKNNKGE